MNYPLALNACIAAMLAIVQSAPAAPRDVSAEITALRPEIVSAKVYHIADSLSFRTRRDEAYTASGCFYAASGDDLAALLDVLATAGLKQTPRTPDGFYEVRTVMYLAKRDGGTVPLLLNLRAPGMSSYGSYERTVYVEADGAFSTALHAWMKPRTQIDPVTSKPCRNIFD